MGKEYFTLEENCGNSFARIRDIDVSVEKRGFITFLLLVHSDSTTKLLSKHPGSTKTLTRNFSKFGNLEIFKLKMSLLFEPFLLTCIIVRRGLKQIQGNPILDLALNYLGY